MASPSSSATSKDEGLFSRPFWWLLLAIGLTFIPLAGYMSQAGMDWEEIHPAINAMLNGTCFVFLCAGLYAIKRGDEHLHKQCMLAALVSSSVFLVSYLARYAMTGTHRYPGDGWPKVLYLAILFSHMLLAIALVPMCLRSIYLGLKGERARHRRLARITWPIWAYVSVTGVIVYVMLYHLA